jgi:hypothetical protein
MFPGARFVHIVRDPFVVFPSTVNLWTTLYRKHALEPPSFAGLEEQVLETFERMYEVFQRDRSLVAADRLCEVTYEELVRDPIGQMRRVYDELALGDFDNVLPRLEAYVAATQGYETNRYDLAPELRAEIARRWQPFIRRYGYSAPEEGRAPRTDGDSRKGAKAQR